MGNRNKRSQAPSLKKGFYFAKEDINPAASYVVYPGTETYPMGDGVTVISLTDMLRRIVGKKA